MSKVQVDTIVDKDDISAPSLTKGAIVTGVCTATSFDGAISEWVLGANGSSDYTFTGSGLTGAENDPTLYLKRGQKYRFKNSSGGHPFRIQSTANGSTGTAYNDGVTNNDAGDGTTLEWDVQFDAPDVLYYQCTSHGGMGGKIYIGNSGNSSTLVDLNVSGVTTTGIATVTTSVVVGSAVTANADGVITAGVGTFGSVVSSGAISGTTGTYTGQLSVADKVQFTVASPQLEFNNGGPRLWSPAANTLTIHTGGGFDSASNERLRIDSAGKVGIGTTIPTRSFDVRGDATIGIDQHSGNPGTTVGILTVRGHHVNSDSEYAQLYLANSNSSGGSTASIRANRDATSNYATSLSFFTNHTLSAGNGDERLRIGTTGQLGLSAGGVGVAATDYGTSGQVLTSGGASATATWTTPSSGAWQLVNSGTIDSVTQVISDSLDSTYQMYRMNFYIEMASNSQLLGIRVKTGGSTQTSNYFYQQFRGFGDNEIASYSSSDNRMYVSGSSGFRVGTGTLTFGNVESTTATKIFRMAFAGNDSLDAPGGNGSVIANTFSAGHDSTTAITGISFFKDGSAPTNGWFVLEGCAIS